MPAQLLGPIVRFVADWHREFVVNKDAGQMETEIAACNWMGHLNARADATVDFCIGEEIHITFTKLLVVLCDFQKPFCQILNAQFGDRIAIAGHGQHALRLE